MLLRTPVRHLYTTVLKPSRVLMANKPDKLIFTGTDRYQYTKGQLEIDAIDANDPFKTFHEWFAQAKSDGITADAVCLSTAELPTGRVSSRMVLLKELDRAGFVM